MRFVPRGVRVFSLSLGFLLAACGGSSGTKDGGGDAAAGARGSADGGDAAAGSDGAAGSNVGTAGQSGHDGGADGGTAGAEGCIGLGNCGDADAPDGAIDVSSDVSADVSSDVSTDVSSDVSTDVSSDVSTDASSDASSEVSPDASSDDSSDVSVEAPTPVGLCSAYTIHAPVVAATIINNGKAPDVAGFLGGALASGTYFLTTVVHFGATYAGPTQEVLVVDATAHTLGDASVVGATTTYVGYATSLSAAVLSGAPSCGGATATMWNYLVTGTGAGSTLSLNAVGSSDVKVFTKQ
jgi:hypothetical protein